LKYTFVIICGTLISAHAMAYILTTCTLCLKNIPNIFDCNLKTDCQILIIFGTNIHSTTCHQMLFSFLPHPTFVFALPGENTTSEISLFIRCDMIA